MTVAASRIAQNAFVKPNVTASEAPIAKSAR